MIQDKIVKLKAEICSKIMRSGYWNDLDPPLDIRIDEEDVIEDILRLRQLQDLYMDEQEFGPIIL